MAYASVASLIQTIDLVNYHDDSSISSSRFNDQIKSLHEHASFLQSFLEDDDPNRAKNWEETIREVADRAEEIIDLLVSDSLLKSIESGLDGGVDELEKVREEMESTADRVKGRRIKAEAAPDEELMNIISRLREGSRNLETIAIVGMPGTGRSTLARNACNHPLVMEHFDVRAWSKLSGESSGKGIILDLLRNINIGVSDSGYEEAMEILHRSLYGRRYLIVLQDVWIVSSWDEVRRALPDNGNGSRIILTTGSMELANCAGHVHEMSMLSEDQSWNLLREKIFKGEPCPSKLEHYGKIISNDCRGFPLIIEVVSGILAADQTEPAWKDVSENIIITPGGPGIFSFLEVMSLSYTYLPHRLRPYFLYLGCFPYGQEIRLSKLIKLWVAEGFLNQSESKSVEEIGEEIVEILVQRSLVSVSKRKSNGRIKSITVHGFVWNLCVRQARVGNFIHDGRGVELQSCRRVCGSDYSHDFFKDLYASTIRTLISYGEVGVGQSIGDVRLLRILDLSNARDYDLPGEVFQLFHLRYLAFHPKFSISKAISNLQNLQTLIICPRENGAMFDNLPEGIWRMPQLRHLYSCFFKLPTLKQGEAALENLETLSRVVDFVCSRENLKMIPNVKKLNIFYTDEVEEDIELHNLISLLKLEILKIEIEWPSFVEKHKMSFAFPPTLKKLNLCGLQLPWEDMKIVASLPNLEVLKLRNGACIGETWETSKGGFSRLTYLMIEETDPEEWITESSHFPRLKTLVLRSCLHMSKVPCEIGEIPTLQLMELDGKNQSLLNSAKQILGDRQSLGDDQLQILVLA